MKNINYIFSALFLFILISSCSHKILPYYTNVDNILLLKEGMTHSQVNDKLRIGPYDILFLEDSVSIYEYDYRIKNRNMKIGSSKDMNEQQSQTKGILWYEDPSKLYVKFFNDRMESYITLSGLKDGEFLLLDKNNIKVINEDDLNDLERESRQNVIILEGSGESFTKVKMIDYNNKKSVE